MLVVIGIARALWIAYKIVGKLAQRMLARAEDYIVDWGAEEEGQQQNRQQGEEVRRDQQPPMREDLPQGEPVVA